MELFSRLFFITFLVLLNAFFVASEVALITTRKTKIAEFVKKGVPTAQLIFKALEDIQSYISSIQIGITIVNIILGWLIGDPVVNHIFQSLFFFLPRSYSLFISQIITVPFMFLIVTYIQIVIGELVPKSIALQRPDLVLQFVIMPLSLFTRIMNPFVRLLNKSEQFFLSALHLIKKTRDDTEYSKEEVVTILNELQKKKIMPKKEVDMVHRIFELKDTPIKHIMVARPDIRAFEENITTYACVKKIKDNAFSRYPIYRNSVNTIVGFIHVKDLYKYITEEKDEKKLKDTKIIRRILYVPEMKKADEVLVDMRKKHIHLAVINDEYGQTTGIVTLENVIEFVIGQIQDEFDKPIHQLNRLGDGSYLVDAMMSLEQLKKRFHFQIKGADYSTVGGFIFGKLGRAPKSKDKVEFNNYMFEVVSLEGKRIEKIRISKKGVKFFGAA